jgi:hypothetical protein
MKRVAPFRQADLQRALSAAQKSGLDIERVEIDGTTGKITIVTRSLSGAPSATPLDDWMKEHAHKA